MSSSPSEDSPGRYMAQADAAAAQADRHRPPLRIPLVATPGRWAGGLLPSESSSPSEDSPGRYEIIIDRRGKRVG